jgi:hypothetical protein
MDYMLSAGAAALTNIGLLGAIVATYVQNMRLIRSYFTGGLVFVASLFIIHNIVIVIFWSKLYVAGPSIKGIVDAAAPYLFVINVAQSVGLAVLLWISRSRSRKPQRHSFMIALYNKMRFPKRISQELIQKKPS